MAAVYPEVFRAQVVFQGKSGLPKDRYINTFHFASSDLSTPDLGTGGNEIGERLREFYLEQTDTGEAVQNFLSGYIETEFQVRVYDLGTPSPPAREAWVTYHDLTAPRGGAALPFEVAVVASFFAERNLPRNRGRIFLGPLNQAVLSEDNDVPMVTPIFRQTLAAAMLRLTNEGVGDSFRWSVLSPTDNEAKVITEGWVDNDFDTIRARTPTASSRTPFGPS